MYHISTVGATAKIRVLSALFMPGFRSRRIVDRPLVLLRPKWHPDSVTGFATIFRPESGVIARR